MGSWGKLWTTRYKKTKNPAATSEEPGAKAGCREQKQGVGSKSRVLRMPPALNPTKGWAKHLSHPSGPTLGHTPTLTPCKEQALPR